MLGEWFSGAGQEHHKADYVPNKSILLSAHNHLNNIYLMACTSTQGVELLGVTTAPLQKHATTITYTTPLKWSDLQGGKKSIKDSVNYLITEKQFIRNECLSSYLDQQWKGAFSLL